MLITLDPSDCGDSAAIMQQSALLKCRILGALELLPVTPTQANYDSLSHFLEPIQAGFLPDTASKARILAKVQHQVDWVQQHMRQGSSLCLKASELVNAELSAVAGR